MKRYMIKYWFLLMFLTLAACQKKEELGSTAKGSVTLKATIETDGTRTSVDEEGHVSWVEADAIGVFGNETMNARFQSISSGSSVFFVGEMNSRQDIPILAYYPYDENAVLDGNTLHFTLPSEYTFTGESKAPMLGIKQADRYFMFNHPCGLLKVTIKNMPENAKRLFVVSEGTEEQEAPAIIGDVVVSDVTVEGATLSIVKNEGHEVSIDLENIPAQETYTFYIPVPVGEYPKLSVKLEMNDGVIYMDKSVSNVNMVRAMMLDMPMIDLFEKKPDLGENMVLGDNTVLLTKEFEKYISSVVTDEGVINLDISFPKNKLPKVGEILFYKGQSDKFPYGFLGKVSSIDTKDDGYKITTLGADLAETFDRLYINEICTFDIADNNIESRSLLPLPNSSVEMFEPSLYWDYNGYIGVRTKTTIKAKPDILNTGIKFGVEGDWNFGRFSFSTNLNGMGEIYLNWDLVTAIKMHIQSDIENKTGKNYRNFKLYFLYKEDFLFEFSGDIAGEVSILYNLLKKKDENGKLMNFIGITKNDIPIKLSLGLGPFLEVDATCEIKHESNSTIVLSPELTMDGVNNIAFDEKEIQEFLPEKINGIQQLDGSVKYGVKLEAKAEILNTSLTGSTRIERTFDSDIKELLDVSQDNNEFDLYSKLLDKKVVSRLNANLTSNISINLYKEKDIESGKDIFEPLLFSKSFSKDKVLFTDYFYYVPSFVLVNEINGGISAFANYTIDRDLAFPAKLGIALLDSDDKLLAESSTIDYWCNGVSFTSLINSFENLNPMVDYYIRPTINLPFWGKMYANPIVEKKALKLITYSHEVNGRNFTCSCKLGNIIYWSMIEDFGICYNKLSTSETFYVSSNNLIADVIKAENYNVELTDLSPGIYEYRAYVKIGDEYYYADETKTFEIGSECSITTTEATNITQTTATLSGNIQGYEADDFMHRYGIIYSTDTNPTASNGTIVYSNNIQEDGNYSVDVASLTENTTYYYRAFVIENGKYVYGDVMSFTTLKPVEDNEGMTEREILIAFYKATDGDNWNQKGGWCSNKPLSEWHGITTDAEGHVTEIFFNYFGDGNRKGDANLSGLKYLKKLYLGYDEGFTSLNVSNCLSLEYIDCQRNLLTSLITNNCVNLKEIYASENKLTQLDVKHLSNLKVLNVALNQLSSIDVSGLMNLEGLYLTENKFSSLQSLNCTNLKSLWVNGNNLESIDVSDLENLEELNVSQNQLKSLDEKNLPKSLLDLECSQNTMSQLNVNGLNALKKLWCYNNLLSELNVSNMSNLESIYCNGNTLLALDVSTCTSLIKLSCGGNPLNSLNVKGLSNLKELELTNIDFVYELHHSTLVELDLTGCDNLEKLSLTKTYLKKIYSLPSKIDKTNKSYIQYWGTKSWEKYKAPNHYGGYQYPEFIY